jgi:hypothetical protein
MFMRTTCSALSARRFLLGSALAATIGVSLGTAVLVAQQPASSRVDVQREAMRKLSFLAGRWSGPVTIVRGPGEPLHLTQTENVHYELDGLVLLVEGQSTSADGKVLFSALATIAYDDAARVYRFRAYHDGQYVDTELAVPTDGFSWSYDAGPAHIVNTMHLSGNGDWHEVTTVAVAGNSPRRSVEMQLHRRP